MLKPYTRTVRDRTNIYKLLHPMLSDRLDICLQKYLHDIYTVTVNTEDTMIDYIHNQELVHIIIYLHSIYLYIPSYRYSCTFNIDVYTIGSSIRCTDFYINSCDFNIHSENDVVYITLSCTTLEEVLTSMNIHSYTIYNMYI